jgi:hypothetical protein
MSPVYKFSNAGGFTSKQRYTSMLAGNATFVPTSFESIATTTVGSGGQSTITFSSITQTYKHLQIRLLGKATASAYLKVTFNSSTTGYADHYLDGNGTSATAGVTTSTSFISIFGAIANTTANVFGGGIIDILDYANTNKNTTLRALTGVDYNGSGNIDFSSGLWNNTAAINQIEFSLNTGNFAQYSHFALYGIKAA